jgi:hypothetical protein
MEMENKKSPPPDKSINRDPETGTKYLLLPASINQIYKMKNQKGNMVAYPEKRMI